MEDLSEKHRLRLFNITAVIAMLAVCLTGLLVLYVAGALISWEFNPWNWNGISVTLTVVLGGIFFYRVAKVMPRVYDNVYKKYF